MNPELRASLATFQRNLESANETAAENIYTFTQLVVDPCLGGLRSCFTDFSTTCFPSREDRLRRRRARSRGRFDYHFDFYDDWENEDALNSSSWSTDELDSLLAGSRSRGRNAQPGRIRAMSYGTKTRRPNQAPDEAARNVVPQSSYLGFLERFRWWPGGRGVRYKPSPADLQENPGRISARREEIETLLEESEESNDELGVGAMERRKPKKSHTRQRSDTGASDASKSTTNSLSSRGDLIMGDEEDDAVPLDDEFAVMLSRQMTGQSHRRPGVSRKSTRAASSKSARSAGSKRSNSSRSIEPMRVAPVLEQREVQVPSMATLRAEEESLRIQQEMEIDQKRKAAQALATDKGMRQGRQTPQSDESVEVKSTETQPAVLLGIPTEPLEEEDEPSQLVLASPVSGHDYNVDIDTEPFPSFPTTPTREMDDDLEPP